MSQLPKNDRTDRETLKRRKLNADALIRKVEAKLAKAKAEKVSEIIRNVKEALNGAGVDFHPREWRVEEERKEDGISYKIIYVPTSRSFDSTGEATAYLEREGDGLRADLLAALTAKLGGRRDHVSREAWSCEWFQGKIVYHCIERHQPTFASEAEAIDFACQGFTSRDEDIAQEFRGVIAQCDDLLGQISELFATAMTDLLCNTAGADDSSGHGEVPIPLSILAGGYEADEDNDDDEDYSDSSD